MTANPRYRNLLAVPSFHYHPIFAQQVRGAFEGFRPTAVALEVREDWAKEFEWAVSCWPSPMVSFASHWFLPVVPGDSMVEAYRLAREGSVPVFFIDLCYAEPIRRARGSILPDPAFAPRVGDLFVEAVDAIEDAAGSPAYGDVAREAYMASRLDALLREHARVLWVGGMGHWTRIRNRLEEQSFIGPRVPLGNGLETALRMRLAWSALHRLTQRLPFHVSQFARQPARYSESGCLTKLALAAVKPEKFQPIEVGSMLLYARNLVAMGKLDETPGLWELLTSSSSVLGNEYASRLATLALLDRFGPETYQYPMLTHSVEENGEGKRMGVFRCDGRVIDGEPLWNNEQPGSPYFLLPSRIEIKRRGENNPAAHVKPARDGEKTYWYGDPREMKSYEAFVRYVLLNASRVSPDDTKSEPLRSGLAEGLDVRSTIRHWYSNEIFVREPARSTRPITNGLIDWTSDREDSPLLQNTGSGKGSGWIDPNFLGIASASWEISHGVPLQQSPFRMQRNFRQLSLITLDAPTSLPSKTGTRKTFFDLVILDLVGLKYTAQNNLYGWLEVMFRFCRNKPFAYYSRYKPSSRIVALGRAHGVSITYVPFSRIPERMVQRHRSFTFMNATPSQWEDLLDKIGESNQAWTASTVETLP